MNLSFANSGKFWLKILISLVITGLLFSRMDMSKLTHVLSEVHINTWLIAMGLLTAQTFALAYRWQYLINAHERRITFGSALKVTLTSMIANYLFITSIGGIIVRVAMSVQSGISLTRSIAATVLDRAMTLLALLILMALFLHVLGDIVSHDVYQNALFILLLFSIAAFTLSIVVFETFRHRIIFSHRKVAMCFQYLRKVVTSKKLLIKVISSSLLAQIAYFAAVYVVSAHMGVTFSWMHFISIMPLITIIASLPIGYGGWGIREGAFVYGLGMINIPAETAFAISVQIGVISMITAFIMGIPALLLHIKNSTMPLRIRW